MPVLGVIIPNIVAVKVYDTETNVVTTEPGESSLKLDENELSFESLFKQLNVKFDLLVILRTILDENHLTPIIAVAKNVAKAVYIVPPLMARFMAVINALAKDTLSYSTCFAIVTDALGIDAHLFYRKFENSFRCKSSFFLKSGEIFHFQELPLRPDKIILLTLKNGSKSQVLPIPKSISCKKVELDSFTQMLYDGAIAKAKQLAGLWDKPYVLDFALPIVAHIGQESIFITRTGQLLPFKKSVLKNIDVRNVKIEVTSREELTLVNETLERRTSKIFFQNGLSHVLVSLNFEVNEYGVTTVSLTELDPADATEFEAIKPDSMSLTVNSVKQTQTSNNVLLAHVFLSSKFVQQKVDNTPTEYDVVNVDSFASGTDLTIDLVKSYYEIVLSRLPNSIIEPSIFILNHNGTYPLAFLKAGLEFIETKFEKFKTVTFVVSDLIAYTRYALKRLHHTTVDNSSYGFIALNNNTDCRTFFIEQSEVKGWAVIDTFHESYTTTRELCQFLSSELELKAARTKLLLTMSAPLSLQNLMTRHNVTIKRVKNFDRPLFDGIFDFGDCEIKPEQINKQSDFVSTVYIQQDDDDEFDLIKHSQAPFKVTVKHQLKPGFKTLTIYQKLAVFSDNKFVLFQCNNVPESVTDLSVTFECDPFELPRIFLNPALPEANYVVKISESCSTAIETPLFLPSTSSMLADSSLLSNVPSSAQTSMLSSITTSCSSTTPVSQINGRIKHLSSMKVEIIVTCDIASQTAQIELFENETFTVIPDINDNPRVPLFVSFAEKDVRVGFLAMHDFIKHPKSVVWDFLHILGRTALEVTVNSEWHFKIHELPNSSFTTGIEVEIFERGATILPAHLIFSCFLRAVQKLVQLKTGKKKKNFFFCIPQSATKAQKGIREGCKFIDLFFAGSNLLKN